MLIARLAVCLMMLLEGGVTGKDATDSAQVISAALRESYALRQAGKFSESAEVLREAAEQVLSREGADSDAGTVLSAALSGSRDLSDPKQRESRLYIAIDEARAALDFKPIMEAPLPRGFPPPGPVGKVVVKEYPAYRAARVTTEQRVLGDNSAFGQLFEHITSNDVKMTAPVEMTYQRADEAGQRGRMTTMAFLYEHPEQGASGTDGAVEVVDLPAVMVISVGIRGLNTPQREQAALLKLDAFLRENSKRFEVAGEMRYLGYNSPFVLPNLRFAEMQIPVRQKSE